MCNKVRPNSLSQSADSREVIALNFSDSSTHFLAFRKNASTFGFILNLPMNGNFRIAGVVSAIYENNFYIYTLKTIKVHRP